MVETLEFPDVGVLKYETETADRYRFFTHLVLESGDKKNNILSLLPPSWIMLDGRASFSSDAGEKRIYLKGKKESDWVFTTLHEIGHANQALTPGFSIDINRDAYEGFMLSESWINPALLIYVLENEFSAWDFVIQKVNEWSLSPNVRERLDVCIMKFGGLESYVNGATTGYRIEQASKNAGIQEEELKKQLLNLYDSWLIRNGLKTADIS